MMRVNYSCDFAILASKHIAKADNPQSVDWTVVHDEILGKSIGVDVRNPTRALADLLHYSPDAVTHEEQDLLCARLEELLQEHSSAKRNRPRM